MINLLPLRVQKQLQREYRYRVFIVGVGLIAVTLFIFVVILGTLYFVLKLEKSQLEKLHTNNLASQEIQNNIATINDLQNKLRILSFDAPHVVTEQFSALVEMVITAKNEDIHIQDITIQNNDALVIDVKGIADTREGLVKYLESLKANPLFLSVNSPVSNLSRSADISFSINIDIATENHEE